MKPIRSPLSPRARLRAACALLLALAVLSPSLRAQAAPEPPQPAGGAAVADPLAAFTDANRRTTFESVWRTIRDLGLGPAPGGVNWDEVLARYAPRAAQAPDDDTFYRLLNQMLEELGQSHCAAIPRGGAASASATEATPAGPAPQGGLQQAGDPGVIVREVEGLVLVAAVEPDSPAAAAAVPTGTILRAIDGGPVPPAPAADAPYRQRVEWVYGIIGRLSGPAGRSVRLRVADSPEDPGRDIEVDRAPVPTSSLGHMRGIPAGFSARRLDDGIVHFRLGSFFLPVLESFQTALRQHADAVGLVLDLRGNPGGLGAIAPAMVGFLVSTRMNLGVSKTRDAEMRFPVFPRPQPYLGPVAVLIDESSASTSEILAAALQESGRARVFGRRTAGMVLPSVFHRLPDGGILQFPMADFVTEGGKTLEGKGVEPDVAVGWTRAACLAGRDPALDAAREWLKTIPRK